MSYIRALSNPEGLYVIGNCRGQVEFLGNGLLMPRHVFHGLLERWFTGTQEDQRYRGGFIRETDDFKFRIGYKEQVCDVDLWKSTLTYLCTQNDFRWARR